MRNPQGNTMTRDEAALVLMAICVEWPDSIPEGYEDSGREALWMAIKLLKEGPPATGPTNWRGEEPVGRCTFDE
jgi:hypothetical protein